MEVPEQGRAGFWALELCPTWEGARRTGAEVSVQIHSDGGILAHHQEMLQSHQHVPTACSHHPTGDLELSPVNLV